MKNIPYHEGAYRFEGVVSVAATGMGMQPWRIPIDRRFLFPSLADKDDSVGACCSGIRIAFTSDTATVRLEFETSADKERTFDVLIDGALAFTSTAPIGAGSLVLNLPPEKKAIEIWLEPRHSFVLTGLWVDQDAMIEPTTDHRPRWVHYGSSISQSNAAASPATTWTALAARQKDYHLTNLGFSGNCQLEPMVGKTIRDLPADLITLKLGINVHSGHYSARTFAPAVIGLIDTIREKHPTTPLTVFSPIWSPNREQANATQTSLSLVQMREAIEGVVSSFQGYGDRNIRYVSGLTLFGPADEACLPDGLHPDAAGQHIIAKAILPYL